VSIRLSFSTSVASLCTILVRVLFAIRSADCLPWSETPFPAVRRVDALNFTARISRRNCMALALTYGLPIHNFSEYHMARREGTV